MRAVAGLLLKVIFGLGLGESLTYFCLTTVKIDSNLCF